MNIYLSNSLRYLKNKEIILQKLKDNGRHKNQNIQGISTVNLHS